MNKPYIYHTIPLGELQANCTILMCTKTKEAAIFDAGDNPDMIIKTINKMGAKPTKLINTHGHYDHLGAVNYLKERYNIPFLISAEEEEYAMNPEKNLSTVWGKNVIVKVDNVFRDKDFLTVGELNIEVIEVSGHTLGGCCFLINDILIAGDSVFKESIGRSDLYGGDEKLLIKMIKEKILTLPQNTIIITGHGPSTTVGNELKFNPFLQ